MKRFITMLICCFIMAVILTSCGDTNMNPGIDTISLSDNSQGQQRYLAKPGTNIMINPGSFSGGTEAGHIGDAALNIALVDTTGEEPVVKAQVDDALFFIEDNTSNGVGGKVLFKAEMKEPLNMQYDKGALKFTCNDDGSISFCVYDNGKNTNAAYQPFQFKSALKCDFSKQIICFLNVVTCQGGLALKFTPAGKPEVMVQSDGKFEGLGVYNLTDLLGVAGKSTSITTNFFAEGFDQYVTFNRWEILEFEPGMHFSGATAPVASAWTPYSIKTQAMYPNGFNVEATDYIIGTNGIVRNYRAINGGAAYIGGKYEGNITYDSKLGFMVEGKDCSYVIVSKRKSEPVYYATEADLLARTNGSATPVGNSGYWTMNLTNVATDAESQAAVYVGATLDEAKTYAAESKADMNSISKDSFIEETTLFWDT
ncbi:MAG: hypothetical protein K0S55_1054, partial [Clostridia bacterium]|nr:hypothetical protein [Clostridia bacterium]